MLAQMTVMLVLAATLIIRAAIPTGDTVTNSIGMKFKRIPAGTFMMGYEGDTLPAALQYTDGYYAAGIYNEKPQHRVTLTDAFYIGVYEVKIGDFKKYHPPVLSRYASWEPQGDAMPVYRVSWFEADSFCKWLSANDPNGWTYRLPTEAEWEYACRANTTTRFYTGDTVTPGLGNFDNGVWDWTLVSVGGYAPNPWGLYDMLGNAREWCGDWYGPFTAENQTNPGGYTTGSVKIQKGLPEKTRAYWRCAVRAANHPWLSRETWKGVQEAPGFRVVISETTPALKVPVDTLEEWQTIISQGRPVPITAVSGATFTDGDGRNFTRVLLKPVALHAPYPSQRDSIVYVSASPLTGPDNADRKSAGLLAQALSLKYGVLYRVSNRYELAFSGITAQTGDYFLTIVPDLAYVSGQPHPDVNYYRSRRLQAVNSTWKGSDHNIVSGMVYSHMLTELPNGALCVGTWNATDEDGGGWASTLISLLPNRADAWSNHFLISERPGIWDGHFAIYGDHWSGQLWMPFATSLNNGISWTYGKSAPGSQSFGVIFPLNGDTLQYLAHTEAVAYRSTDSGATWSPRSDGLGYDAWAYQSCQLDDGRMLNIPRNASAAPDASSRYFYDVRTASVDTLKGPFLTIGCCGLACRLIKLQSGRLLFIALTTTYDMFAIGESVDGGQHWFVRRTLSSHGEGEICQSRDGIIHVLFDDSRFTGGANAHFSFSEEWLREGTALPMSEWAAANYANSVDTAVKEPGYLPPMGTQSESKLSAALSIKLSAAPNPFTPSTTIRYALPLGSKGTLSIINVKGEVVYTTRLATAQGQLRWEKRDLPSGLYLARLAGQHGLERTLKILRVK